MGVHVEKSPKNLLVTIFLLLNSLFSIAVNPIDKKELEDLAGTALYNEQYELALEYLKKLDSMSASEEESIHFQYNIGVCYYHTEQYKKAVNALTKAKSTKNLDELSPEVDLMLGKALHKSYEFTEGKEILLTYISKINANGGPVYEEDRNHYNEAKEVLAYCNNGLTLQTSPVNYIIRNLGPEINSKYSEYSPLISADESIIYFTSRKEGSTGEQKDVDGQYFEDIYVSRKEGKDNWGIPQKVGGQINTDGHDASSALSVDGQQLFIYRSSKKGGQILESRLKNENEWGEPLAPEYVSKSKSWETSLSISSDGSTVFFTSNREGSSGGKDIYKCEKLADGRWGIPENLGPKINSEMDEESPFIHPDGKTLYFSSRGHNSMGGFDLFKSTLINGTWTPAENLGFPLNTPFNDVNFVITANGKRGYYASKHATGYGREDIYLIDIPEANIPLTMVRGTILCADSLKPLNVRIKLKDVETGQFLKHVYRPNPSSGKYLIILPPGKNYDLIVEDAGHQTYEVNIHIPNQSRFFELYQTIHLKAKPDGSNPDDRGIKVDNTFFSDYGSVVDPQAEVLEEMERHNELLNMIENIIESSDTNLFYNLDEEIDEQFKEPETETITIDSSLESLFFFVEQLIENTDSLALEHIDNIIERGEYSYEITPENEADFFKPEDSSVEVIGFELAESVVNHKQDTLVEKVDEMVEEVIEENVQSEVVREEIVVETGEKTEEVIEEQKEEIIKELVEEVKVEKPSLPTLYFNFNSNNPVEAEIDFEKLKAYLAQNKTEQLIIEGHTDDVGGSSYNLALGKQRAESVKQLFVNHGIPSDKIKTVSKGLNEPITSNENEEGREKNRRVELNIR